MAARKLVKFFGICNHLSCEKKRHLKPNDSRSRVSARKARQSSLRQTGYFPGAAVPSISGLPSGFPTLRCFSSVGDSVTTSEGGICQVSSVSGGIGESPTCCQLLKTNGATLCSWNRKVAHLCFSRSCSLRSEALNVQRNGQVMVRGALGSRT